MLPEQKTSWLVWLRQSAAARRQRRLDRNQQPPWIWKLFPEGQRKFAASVFTCLGMFALAVAVSAAIWGIIFAPLAIAAGHKGSGLENAMRWYIHLFSKDKDGSAYVFTQICIAGVLFYFIRVSVWLNKQKQGEKLPREKSEAVK